MISVTERNARERPIPWQLKDAVELWAREHGRHLHRFERNAMGVPVIELDLHPDDPRLAPWKAGKLRHKPTDPVMLMYQPTYTDDRGKQQKSPHFQPMDLEQMGVSGVLEILNRGNLASGTGEFRDIMEAVQSVAEKNDRLKQSIRDAARDGARQRARDITRTLTPKSFVPREINQ